MRAMDGIDWITALKCGAIAKLADGGVGPTIKGGTDRVQTRMLTGGTRPMDFGRLPGHLGAVVRNTMRPKGARPGDTTFALTTRPTSKPRQALDLIAVIEP